jgi:glucose-6-phosphate isomerase
MLLMDDMAGDFQPFEFNKGVAVHIPPQYAHRVVNTGSDIFIFVSVFHVKAGHAYAQVTERGFSNLAVEKNGKPVLRPNPLH